MRITKGLFIGILIFIIFFFGYLIRSDYDLALWDEGWNAYMSERVRDGHVPYKDFHISYAPGRFFIQALMFKIFGVTLAVERAYIVLVIALFAVISYLLARQLKINLWLSIWITILVSHNSTSIFLTPSMDRILFSFIAILGMILYDKTEKKIWLIVTGILCSMNILIGQETGIYTLVALILFLFWRSYYRNIGLFICSIFIAFIPFLIYTIFHENIGNTIQDLLINTITGHRPTSFSFKDEFTYFFQTLDLRSVVFFSRFLLAMIIPMGTLFFLFIKMIFYKEKVIREDGYLLMLSLFGISLGIVLALIFSPQHLLMALPPTYIMAMLYFENGCKYFYMNKFYLFKIISFIFIFYLSLNFLATTASTLNSYIGPFRKSCWKLDLPRAKIFIPRQDKIGPDQRAFPFKSEKAVKELINHIQSVTPNNEPIFIVSQDAMLYFLADRDNPTGYDLIMTAFDHINSQQSMIKDLENKRCKYVVLSNVPYANNYSCKDEIRNIVPHLYNYIMKYYQFETKVGFYEFWKRINFLANSSE